MSAQLCLVLFVLFSFVGFTLYINYESMLEGFMDQFKLGLMILPLVGRMGSYLLPMSAKDSIHRAGGSPWGLGALLVFLIVMVFFFFLKEKGKDFY
ncbi:hypothetical protein MKW94_027315 [Papaver nudicaule]|uniref:Uncharacterized protein n=1 Tax=Papaver nudicaule TaxID=74823 RepID=A0AA41VQR9_PAPNU|nr:hypothetical protein [Papaver nudicaule]